MGRALNGLVSFVVTAAVSIGVLALIPVIAGVDAVGPFVTAGLLFGGLYGMELAALESHDLSSGMGWFTLLIDLTWSLPNTIFGFVLGNLVYIFFANPSHAESKHNNWVVFKPRSATGFGNNVLQTLGTVNIGGAGHHERMHLLQARILGPLYLPLFLAMYVVTSLLQLLWTGTLGWVLKAAGVRQTAWFEPPAKSAVGGFFGWIYYATPFELWAYASGNP